MTNHSSSPPVKQMGNTANNFIQLILNEIAAGTTESILSIIPQPIHLDRHAVHTDLCCSFLKVGLTCTAINTQAIS